MTQVTPNGDAVFQRPVVRAVAAYEGHSSMIAQARRFTTDFLERVLGEQHPGVAGRLLAEAQLVVSELVTNVVKHAPGPCELTVELEQSLLRITVTDTSTAVPRPHAPDPSRIGRHGLEIVAALCAGLHTDTTAAGKAVTACLALS